MQSWKMSDVESERRKTVEVVAKDPNLDAEILELNVLSALGEDSVEIPFAENSPNVF